jgi:O-acetyl-ADP-ribose deacetylase (regulator of RNase III)
MDVAEADTVAVLRPVAADLSAVDPAARRLELAAGTPVAEHLLRLGDLPVGSAVLTPGGLLFARFIVHAVVRSADEPVTPAGVQRALRNGLRRLDEWAIASVTVVPLGTGAGNLDAEESAQAMIPVLSEHLAASATLSAVTVAVATVYEREVFAAALP